MFVFTVYVMFAIFNCCGQKLLYADFANKIYHISLFMDILHVIKVVKKQNVHNKSLRL